MWKGGVPKYFIGGGPYGGSVLEIDRNEVPHSVYDEETTSEKS